MITPCAFCECPNYCNELNRCIGEQFRNANEGELADDTDDDELTAEKIHIKNKKVKVPEKLTKEHRNLLRDFLNF